MTWTRVQDSPIQANNDDDTTASPVFDNPTTAGNLVIFLGCIDKTSGNSTDWDGFTEIEDDDNTSNSILLGYIQTVGGETSWDITWATDQVNKSKLIEYSVSSGNTWAFDDSNVENSSNGVVSSQDTGSITVANAGSLLVAGWSGDTATQVDNLPVVSGAGLTQLDIDVSNNGPIGGGPLLCYADNLNRAAGAAEGTYSCSDTGDQMSGVIAAFREIVGSGGDIILPQMMGHNLGANLFNGLIR